MQRLGLCWGRGAKPLACCIALALANCGGGPGLVARYTGAVPGCGLAAATLTRQAGQFAFAPGDGVLTIVGKVGADGGFAGTLNTQPPGKAPYVLNVRGTITDDSATLDYATPRCRGQATLSRVHPPLL